MFNYSDFSCGIFGNVLMLSFISVRKCFYYFSTKYFMEKASNGMMFCRHHYGEEYSIQCLHARVTMKVEFDAESQKPLRISFGEDYIEWETVVLITWGWETPTLINME